MQGDAFDPRYAYTNDRRHARLMLVLLAIMALVSCAMLVAAVLKSA